MRTWKKEKEEKQKVRTAMTYKFTATWCKCNLIAWYKQSSLNFKTHWVPVLECWLSFPLLMQNTYWNVLSFRFWSGTYSLSFTHHNCHPKISWIITVKCIYKSELIKLKLISWPCILCLAWSFPLIFCRVILMSLK